MKPFLEKAKNILDKRIAIGHILSLLLICFCSLKLTNIIFSLNVAATEEEILFFQKSMETDPFLFWLNCLPIFLLILLFYFLTNHTLFSICFWGGIFYSLAFANSMKIQMRQDPVLPSDVKLIKEVIGIVRGFDVTTLKDIETKIVLFLLLLLLSLVLFQNKKMNGKIRISGIVGVIVGGLIVNQMWYNNEKVYQQYPVLGNIYFSVNQYHSKGFMYCFFHNINTMKVKKPNHYNEIQYAQAEKPPTLNEEQTENLPHIIMIMGEAYSDLSINEHIDFTHYDDPMEEYKKIISQEDTIAGHIVVPNFGGGTSDTEYDVLTACPTRYLDNASPSYDFVRKKFDALPRRLAEIGYNTLAIHPGYYWFYNRYNVYPYFGFQNFIHLSSFDPHGQSKGGYITDEAAVETILNTLQEHIQQSDKPLFSFTVTIQNHGPYEDKYNAAKQNFDTDIVLTEQEKNLLYNYFHGMKDADKAIGTLVKELDTIEEPVIVVYFGDHLPGFSNGMDFFDILDYDIDIEGTIEQRLAIYETPYFIWQNENAKNTTKILENKQKMLLPEGNIISSHYLGAMTMELIGLEGLSPLYDYVNEMRKELPVTANGAFLEGNGNYKEEVTEQQQKKIDYLAGWQYYKLFDEK
ncbi:LTA synthase family protein [Lachnospiraceae bacterium 46-61]